MIITTKNSPFLCDYTQIYTERGEGGGRENLRDNIFKNSQMGFAMLARIDVPFKRFNKKPTHTFNQFKTQKEKIIKTEMEIEINSGNNLLKILYLLDKKIEMNLNDKGYLINRSKSCRRKCIVQIIQSSSSC